MPLIFSISKRVMLTALLCDKGRIRLVLFDSNAVIMLLSWSLELFWSLSLEKMREKSRKMTESSGFKFSEMRFKSCFIDVHCVVDFFGLGI